MRAITVACRAGTVTATVILLSAATSFQSVVVSPRRRDLDAAARRAVTEFAPSVNRYLAELRDGAHEIGVRVRMHDRGDPSLNGCGFYARADGYAGSTDVERFPPKRDHRCGANVYRMRTTAPGRDYSAWLRLGGVGERVGWVELHADGWHDTAVDSVCVGFGGRTVEAGEPRGFCVDNRVLAACGRPPHGHRRAVNEERGTEVTMTRTARGTHKIVFRDVGPLSELFSMLCCGGVAADANATANALDRICDRIELVAGDYKRDYDTCTAAIGVENLTRYVFQEKNPYGCYPLPSLP